MSSRQMRKIRQQQELLKAIESERETREPEDEEEGEGEEEVLPVAKPRASLFAALGGDDEEEQDEQSETEDAPEPQPAPTTLTKKNKKKKKKGKKKQVVTTQNPDEDDIDRALKELNIKPRAAPGGTSNGTGIPEHDTVLHISTHHLRDIHELRQVFGRDAIDAVLQTDREEERAARRRQGQQRATVDLEAFLKGDSSKKLPEISLRRNIFVEGKESWPRATSGGLSMEEVRKDPEGGWVEYRYVHSDQYDRSQIEFFGRVTTGDPMVLVHFLKQHPYHISTLLQVSFFAKHQDGNNPLAADLCERALFTFGRATLTAFRQNLQKGRARLDFYRPENRQFWLVGYHYLKSLIRKGAPRTALEWAKLLFGLDPVEDPYGMCHLIHVLAVKAQETEWLETFVKVFEKSSLHCDIRYYRNTISLGLLQEQKLSVAKERLVENMQDMPWLYCALFQALNLDAPPSIWGVQPLGEVDEFYTELYIHMTKDMWNYPQATDILKDVANLAKKPDELTPTNGVLELRTARFVYLEGISGLIGRIPNTVLDREPNYEFDPLPPSVNENIFSTEGMRRPFQPNQRLGTWLANMPPGEVRLQPALDDDFFDEDEFMDDFEHGQGGLDEFDAEEDIDDDGLGEGDDDPIETGGTTFQRLSRSVREALFGSGQEAGSQTNESATAEEAVDGPNSSSLPGAWPGNEDAEQ